MDSIPCIPNSDEALALSVKDACDDYPTAAGHASFLGDIEHSSLDDTSCRQYFIQRCPERSLELLDARRLRAKWHSQPHLLTELDPPASLTDES